MIPLNRSKVYKYYANNTNDTENENNLTQDKQHNIQLFFRLKTFSSVRNKDQQFTSVNIIILTQLCLVNHSILDAEHIHIL